MQTSSDRETLRSGRSGSGGDGCATEQIVGRERRERLSQLAWCGGGCFDSRRRVNSAVRRLLFSCEDNLLTRYDISDRGACGGATTHRVRWLERAAHREGPETDLAFTSRRTSTEYEPVPDVPCGRIDGCILLVFDFPN